MKKTIVAIVIIFVLVISLCGYGYFNPTWEEKVDSIEIGMTYEELVSLMGKPDANIGSGAELLMYILPDEHVIVVSIAKDYTQEGHPMVVGKKPVVQTYDEFKEYHQYRPDDPNAWWNRLDDNR